MTQESSEKQQKNCFELLITISKTGKRNISINYDFEANKLKAAATLLYSLTNREMNPEILLALAYCCEDDFSKKKVITKLLKFWEELEDVPYIDPFQPMNYEQK